MEKSKHPSHSNQRQTLHYFFPKVDGHVVHHLFFTKVPHYRLEAATTALQVGMKERGQEHLYKLIDTPDYSQEIVKQFHDNWFFVNEENVVREWK
mmetsp:Transcript_22010/g.36066  ORF Transcript_22010/g.36066 Transcript_22010/m.36066 type:complete len:95 (-) Transcript_22010:114-398(-)